MPLKLQSQQRITLPFFLCFFCAALFSSLLFVGCGKSGVQTGNAAAKGGDIRKDLSALGRAYANYIDATRKGPADWQSLIDKSPNEADAIKRVRDAGYTVKWEMTYRGATQGASNTVLAESSKGGPKLMLDGSVTQ